MEVPWLICSLWALLSVFPNKYKQTLILQLQIYTWLTNRRQFPAKAAFFLVLRLDGATVLDIVLARLACRAGRWVAWRIPWALTGAVAAEEAPSYNHEEGRCPSNKQGTSKFIPSHIWKRQKKNIIFHKLISITSPQYKLIIIYSIKSNSR